MDWKNFVWILGLVFLLMPGALWAEETKPVNKLDEVVVTGTRTSHAIKDAPVETVLITREDIEQSNAKTMNDLLKTVPGLSTQGSDDVFGGTSSRARLRGLSFNNGYGLILIDGQRIHASSQSGGHGEYATGLNQIPMSMIERVEVVKGPSSVLYGSDAMAGVINIITRKVPLKAVSGAGVSHEWYQVSERVRDGEVQKPTDDGKNRYARTAYAYTGNRINDNTGFLLNYSHEDSQRNNAAPAHVYRDALMGKLDYIFSQVASGWLKGEVSAFKNESSDISKENDHRIAAGLDLSPTENTTFMFKGYHYLDSFSRTGSYSRKGEIGYDQGECQYNWYTQKGHVITAGIEFQRQSLDYIMDNSRSGLDTITTVKEDVDTFSLYLQDEWSLLDDKLVLVPGIRFDDHSTFGTSFNPKLNMMYRMLDNTSMRATVGKSFKSPTIRQLYYDHPFWHSPFWIKSNPDLDPEESIGYSLGFEQWLMEDRGMVGISFFRNDISDMVVTNRTDEEFDEKPLYKYENVEEAMVQGVELSAQLYPTDSFSLSAGFTYTDSEDKSSGNELPYTPEFDFSISPAYEYKPWGLGGSGTFLYTADQYMDDDNEHTQEAHLIVDGKLFKRLSEASKLTFEVDNIFDSDKGDERNYRTGRSFTVCMDMVF